MQSATFQKPSEAPEPVKPQLIVIRGLNPEPWESPEGAIGWRGRKPYVQMHKPATSRAFQEAIKDELDAFDTTMMEGPLIVRFWLWRDLPAYEADSGKQVRRHVADATNMQKAIEDACQGILFKNDNQNVFVQTFIVQQDADVDPCIIIEVTPMTVEVDIDIDAVQAQALPRIAVPVQKEQIHTNPEEMF